MNPFFNKGTWGGPRDGHSFCARCAHCASWCSPRLRRGVGDAASPLASQRPTKTFFSLIRSYSAVAVESRKVKKNKSRNSHKYGAVDTFPHIRTHLWHRTNKLALTSWARGAVLKDIPQNQRVSCCRSLKSTPRPSLQRLQAAGLGSQARARARASRVRPRCRGRRTFAPAARWLARRARTGRQGAQVHK